MANYTVADKSTGDSFAASEHNSLKAAVNSKTDFEVSATYAAIAGGTLKRLVYVTADETNNGDTSLYLHNGTTLKFLQTIA